MLFLIFSVLSCLALIFAVFYCVKKGNSSASPLLLFTGCAFVSVLLFLLPINWLTYSEKQDCVIVNILMTVLNTLQVFINDGSTDTFDLVLEYSQPFCDAVRTIYRTYAAFLIVGAPILTFSNVLALFKDFFETLRFNFSKLTRRVYIMSELNNCSATLARSIIDREPDPELDGGKPARKIVVFTGITDDVSVELISAAKEIGAVLLKKTITERDVIKLKAPSEIYFIGSDDNENIMRASALTEALNSSVANKKTRVPKLKIFAFAHSRASGCVIDSVNYDKLLDAEEVANNIDIGNLNCWDPSFRLRRVDITRQFVWNEIQNMGFFDNTDRKISILIVGLGYYGLEFFKALSWFCHFDGRQLEINILDRMPDIGSKLKRYCPGLLNIDKLNPNYSLELFSGIDLSDTDNFSDILKSSERLKRTTRVIIALGNDELDTETAVYMRELFERINPASRSENGRQIIDENTKIYAVLYDDYFNIERSQHDRRLINYKETPYNINFIGGLNSKYRTDVVYDPELEAEALNTHLFWTLNAAIRDIIKDKEIANADDPADVNAALWKKAVEALSAQQRDKLRGSLLDHDDPVHKKLIKLIDSCPLPESANVPQTPDNDRMILACLVDNILNKMSAADRQRYRLKIAEQVICYERFEYNRLSSMSKALYRANLNKHSLDDIADNNEHNRWMLYMCSIGYISGKRNDRAKTHHDIIDFNKLSENEKFKDG